MKTTESPEQNPACPTCGETTTLHITRTGALRMFLACPACKLRMEGENSATYISEFEEIAMAC